MLKIKLLARGKALTPYVSAVSTNGRVQKAFAKQIGEPVGACVKGKVHKGMSQADARAAVQECAKAKKGTTLSDEKGTIKGSGKK